MLVFPAADNPVIQNTRPGAVSGAISFCFWMPLITWVDGIGSDGFLT
jgi:hypothetical protein